MWIRTQSLKACRNLSYRRAAPLLHLGRAGRALSPGGRTGPFLSSVGPHQGGIMRNGQGLNARAEPLTSAPADVAWAPADVASATERRALPRFPPRPNLLHCRLIA